MFLGNWIRQTTTSTGTGNLTLAAVTGYSQFTDQFASGSDGACDYFFYAILNDSDGTPLEAGVGHITTTGPEVMVRDHILASLVSGTYAETNVAVTLSAGTYRVICTDLNSSRQMSFAGPRSGAAERLIGSASLRTASGNSKTLNTGTVYVTSFEMRTFAIISGAGAWCTGTASANLRVGLYRTKLNGEPGNLICATGDIVSTSTGYVTGNWLTGSQTLKPGRYYIAGKSNGANLPVGASSALAYNLPQDDLPGAATTPDQSLFSFATATDSGSAMSTTMGVLGWSAVASDFAPVFYLVPTTL